MPETEYRNYVGSHVDTAMPRVSWDEFSNYIFDWRQGEHVGLIGPTGSGKSTLALNILGRRKYVTVFATKPKDKTLNELRHDGYKRIKTWEPMNPAQFPRRLLWPPAKNLYAVGDQRKEFRKAFELIYEDGGWCVYIDELWVFIHHMKLEFEIRTYLQQSRSLGISLIAGTQRPKFVPLEIFDQSTHLFFWLDNDEANLKRISGIAWLSASMIRSAVARLDPHEFLYVNTRTAEMYRSIAEER